MRNGANLVDSELFLRLSQRDASALGDLMKGYFPILCAYAERFVEDSALAKDIVQEVFIKFWEYKGSFDGFGNLKAFLFQLTKNGCLNLLRGRERENSKHMKAAQLHTTAIRSIDEAISKLEYLAEINLVVQRLPVKMREVFRLSFEEGLSIVEISRQLGISEKTVRNQKYKSLIILRKHFGQTGIPLLFLISRLFK